MDERYVVSLAGRRLQVVPLNLACCGLELAFGLRALSALAAAGDSATDDAAIDLHVLAVAGTVTPGFMPQIRAAWQGLPAPKVVIGFGVCTLSGGPYWDSYAVVPGLPAELSPIVRVPGCPPHPDSLREALEVALGGVPVAGLPA